MKPLAKNLEAARTKKGLTQEEVAKRIGVARSTYSNYESGKREPDLETIEKLADLLEESVDDLMGRTNRYAGRAFFGGAEQYTEDELEVARAAAEAYRKSKQKNK